MTIWEIINEYLNKVATRYLKDRSSKWHDLYMLEDEPYRDFFSRIDSVVAEYKIKCNKIIQDAEIFSLISTRVHPHIADRIVLFKQNSVGIPHWDIIKKQVVDYSEDCIKRENQMRRLNPSINNATRNQEAYAVDLGEQICFNCNKKGHLRSNCPHVKTTQYGPGMRPQYGTSRCMRCKEYGHLAPNCPTAK